MNITGQHKESAARLANGLSRRERVSSGRDDAAMLRKMAASQNIRPVARGQPEGAPPPRRRGRRLTTGNCASREELCRQVRWYYDNTSLSIEAIGRRFGVSQGAAARALTDGQALPAISE
jgi:hypothetical protein